MQNKKVIILFSHGSRNPNWHSPFQPLIEMLKEDYGDDYIISSYLELSPPTLEEAIALSQEKKLGTHILIVPLFISGSGHVLKDLKPKIESIRQNQPKLTLEIMNAIGEYKEILESMKRVIDAKLC